MKEQICCQLIAADNRKALTQFHENATRYKDITETEREIVVEAIELRLREVAPSAATKIFGSKDSEGREYLEKVYRQFANEFDLSNNQVKNGVKTGGDMISGRQFVDIYLSYKNSHGWHAGLSWNQASPESARSLRVSIYQGGRSNQDSYSEEVFEAGFEEIAKDLYRGHLEELTR